MRHGFGILVAVLALVVQAATRPALADAFEACRSAINAEARLAACSEVIAEAGSTAEQKSIAYRNRGRSRAEAGALDQALADLGEAIRRNASDSQTYSLRAQVNVARRDLDAAVADFSEVVRLRPGSVLGFSGRGHAYLVKGDARKAIADFSEALRLAPKSATAFNNRGLAYKAAGEDASALDDFTAAITINPIYALAYNNRAYLHEAAGRKGEAIADYRRALIIDPALVGAREGLVRVGAMGEDVAAESMRMVAEGKLLVEAHCKGCHAIGAAGDSPNPKAPAFRALHVRHPMLAIREPLTRGIAAPHDEMPKFRLPDGDIDKVIAYINSLELRR